MASPTVIASPHKRLLDRHTQKKLAGIGRVIMILLIMIIVVLPFYVAVLYSFRAPDAITANRLAWPEHPTFQNYLRVIFENDRLQEQHHQHCAHGRVADGHYFHGKLGSGAP